MFSITLFADGQEFTGTTEFDGFEQAEQEAQNIMQLFTPDQLRHIAYEIVGD